MQFWQFYALIKANALLTNIGIGCSVVNRQLNNSTYPRGAYKRRHSIPKAQRSAFITPYKSTKTEFPIGTTSCDCRHRVMIVSANSGVSDSTWSNFSVVASLNAAFASSFCLSPDTTAQPTRPEEVALHMKSRGLISNGTAALNASKSSFPESGSNGFRGEKHITLRCVEHPARISNRNVMKQYFIFFYLLYQQGISLAKVEIIGRISSCRFGLGYFPHQRLLIQAAHFPIDLISTQLGLSVPLFEFSISTALDLWTLPSSKSQ